jgi:hypothetical protein
VQLKQFFKTIYAGNLGLNKQDLTLGNTGFELNKKNRPLKDKKVFL